MYYWLGSVWFLNLWWLGRGQVCFPLTADLFWFLSHLYMETATEFLFLVFLAPHSNGFSFWSYPVCFIQTWQGVCFENPLASGNSVSCGSSQVSQFRGGTRHLPHSLSRTRCSETTVLFNTDAFFITLLKSRLGNGLSLLAVCTPHNTVLCFVH